MKQEKKFLDSPNSPQQLGMKYLMGDQIKKNKEKKGKKRKQQAQLLHKIKKSACME